MKKFGWALAAVFSLLITCAVQAHPFPVYYLTSLDGMRAANRGPSYYAENGVRPIVLLPGNGYNLFTPAWDFSADVSEIDTRIDGEFLVALWCDNVARDEQPGGSTLSPWDNDADWLVINSNLASLRSELMSRDGIGVVFDAEIYTCTPNNNGGLMDGRAWATGARDTERGQQVRAALSGLIVGQYGLVDDLKSRDGWKDFSIPLLGGGGMLLDLGPFLVGSHTKALREHDTENLPGRTIKNGEFKGSVPDKAFWIYPWDGEAATDLGDYAQKWE